MTIMDYSGRVLGMIGGAGEKTENRGLNRAANSYRQPGSSIKPLSVYTPAIEENMLIGAQELRTMVFLTITATAEWVPSTTVMTPVLPIRM